MRPEDAIQASIVNLLAYAQDTVVYAVPNQAILKGGPRERAIQMQRLKKTGLLNGVSDLVVLFNADNIPISVYMEVKPPGEDQRTDQIAFEKSITRLGFIYGIVRSPEDALALLKKAGHMKLPRLLFSGGILNVPNR